MPIARLTFPAAARCPISMQPTGYRPVAIEPRFPAAAARARWQLKPRFDNFPAACCSSSSASPCPDGGDCRLPRFRSTQSGPRSEHLLAITRVLAPLDHSSQGPTTRIWPMAALPANRGHTHLRWMATSFSHFPWAQPGPLPRTHDQLPLCDLVVSDPNRKRGCRGADFASTGTHGLCVVEVPCATERLGAPHLRRRVGPSSARMFYDPRTCRHAGPGVCRSDPRLFSYNSNHWVVPECFGRHRLAWPASRGRAQRRGNLLECLVRR